MKMADGCGIVIDGVPQRDRCIIRTTSLGIRTLATLALLVEVVCPLNRASAQSTGELIEQAHQYDAAYVIGPQVDRQKALALYEKALTAGPDQQQRLQTLFRMAQLHGCIFDLRKGERPDFPAAISLYQQIVESYPPEEPLVMKATGLISDHYATLRRFDAALTWAKRTVEYDTTQAEKHINDIHQRQVSLATTKYSPDERREIMEQAARVAPLQDDLQRMKAGRVAAVDRVAYTARMLDPVREHGELRALADRYSGTPIGDRAIQRLGEAMDKQRDLWGPSMSMELPPDPSPTLQPASDTPLLLTRDQQGMEVPPGPGVKTTTGSKTPPPNTTETPKQAIPLTESPRAPPLLLVFTCLVVAAGLAALRIRRKTLSRNQAHET
jgi:hypothetical protein